MKTTIELTDDLAAKAKRYAARHGVTLRAVIEDGIRLKLRKPRLRTLPGRGRLGPATAAQTRNF